MKQLHSLFFTILFSLFTQNVSGQTNKPCNNFDCAYKKAETFLKNKEYQKALDNLDSAEGYLTDTNTKEKEQIKQLRRRLFVAIEKEKEDAKRARDEAKKQTEIAQKAEVRTKSVLDKIYFYEDKFGLAYDKTKKRYGFIDKQLNTKIEFKYNEALPFDDRGFAKVKSNNVYYLIDTTGIIEHELASEINQLNEATTAVDLRNKQLKEIPPSVFEQLQLFILLLDFNQLSNLPTAFFKLNDLTYLSLRNNQLSQLPAEIGNLTNLDYLDLSGNQLSQLPAEIGKLTGLFDLDLLSNQLSHLPDEIGNLMFLNSLNLSMNQLDSLPNALFKLTGLTNLSLSINQLKNIPPEIGNLILLTSLDVGSNQLSSLPIEINNLIGLKALNVSNNQLSSLPLEITNLTNLTYLDVSGNQLSTLPTDIFKLKNLTFLLLHNNQLRNLPSEISSLSKLRYLYLDKNLISKEEQEKIKKLLPNCDIKF